MAKIKSTGKIERKPKIIMGRKTMKNTNFNKPRRNLPRVTTAIMKATIKIKSRKAKTSINNSESINLSSEDNTAIKLRSYSHLTSRKYLNYISKPINA